MVAWASPPHECAQEEAAGVRTGNLRRQSADECRLRKTAGSEPGNEAATWSRHSHQTQGNHQTEGPSREASKRPRHHPLHPLPGPKSPAPPALQLQQEVGRGTSGEWGGVTGGSRGQRLTLLPSSGTQDRWSWVRENIGTQHHQGWSFDHHPTHLGLDLCLRMKVGL